MAITAPASTPALVINPPPSPSPFLSTSPGLLFEKNFELEKNISFGFNNHNNNNNNNELKDAPFINNNIVVGLQPPVISA
jgi:hypothetical protein